MSERLRAARTSEMGQALRAYKSAFITVAVISVALNIVLLGGSLYMMVVYDSVLPSHSIPTLFSLFLLLVMVYAFQGFFDYLRSQLLNHVANGFDRKMVRRVQIAMSDSVVAGIARDDDGLLAMRDLDSIRSFLGGPGPVAMIDLPWSLFFTAIMLLLHPLLALAVVLGGFVLLTIAVLMNRFTQAAVQSTTKIGGIRSMVAERNLRHAELHVALGMRERKQDQWDDVNAAYLALQAQLGHHVSLASVLTRVMRLFVQSCVFTVGVLLVLNGKASGGVIFAASILSTRALAPIDHIIESWRSLTRARQGWGRLSALLETVRPKNADRTALPAPMRDLSVEHLSVAPPGSRLLTVKGANFRLAAGDALGILGPSGAGKTSLARALLGLWPAAQGTVRLDGAALLQWDRDILGAHFGYLPQTVELSEGTIAQNIARFEKAADSALIIAAAQAAGVHDMIVGLPDGYETPLGDGGMQLSAGQRQRVGLARALYKNPFLVVLDEPNSNLDLDGERALRRAIHMVRARGGIAVIIAHRPSVLDAVNYLLLMRGGQMDMFGSKEDVLKKMTAAQSRKAGESDAGSLPSLADGQ
ncbi:MAG: type I secretion system permease/ATPase [bacterium]|nr:type I secretion system permease/ATPase [bacterium]